MKDFSDFLEYCDQNPLPILEDVYTEVPKDLKLGSEELKFIEKLSAKTALAFLHRYHDWLNEEAH